MALGPTAAGAATAAGNTITPTVTVTPSTNLIDFQTVHVAGKNFPSSDAIATIQCIGAATNASGCDLSTLFETRSSSTGSFAIDRLVFRLLTIPGPSGPIQYDCAKAPGACIMAGADIANQTDAAAVPLSFNPKVPPKKTTVTVTPSTNLVDHQLVTINGGGVAPNFFVGIQQCGPGVPSFQTCDFSTGAGILSGAKGGFHLSYPVHRILELGGPEGTGTVDCAVVKCQLVAGSLGGGRPLPAAVPLSFNPKVPPVSQKLLVFPHGDLVDKQLVTAFGSAFTPGAGVTVVECQAGVTVPFECGFGQLSTVTVGFVGHFAEQVAVHRFIFTPTGLFDCASAPGACVISAFNISRYTLENASAPLSFNPKAPPATVTVTVNPSTGLHDDQAVTVRGTGLTPLGSVQVSECSPATINGVTEAFCSDATSVVADIHGDISTTYFVHRVISGLTGLVACSAKPGRCSLALNEGFNFTPEAEAPLSFG
jgi:hypothetical protein